VLAHELAHVQRRDWLWVIGEEIVRSIFWFHPAVWWLVSRVQLARETVVDELSILATNARRTYLDALLAFADDTGLVSPPAFSARRHLFYRVMLLSKEGNMSSIRVALASCVLMLVLSGGAWGAAQAFPLYGGQQSTDTAQKAPPRDALSVVELHRRGVELFEKARKDTTLTLDQKLDTLKKGVSFEDRALEREPNYVAALVYKNLLLRMQAQFTTDSPEQRDLIRQADELRDQALTLQRAGAGFVPEPAPGDLPAPPPPPPPPPPGGPGTAAILSPMFDANVARLHPVRVGGNLKTPTKIRDVKPEYPTLARESNAQGVVILEVLLDTDGSVADARILRSIPIFDEAALGAVRQWKFVPTLLNGQPTAMLMTVTVNFTLSQP
jgi:TonB family protein